MSDPVTVNPAYAIGRLQRALRTIRADPDPALRARSLSRVAQWEAVLLGMADGHLDIGSRTPVAGTPAWVTLEVAHGGFATGGFVAAGPLGDHETARLSALSADVPGDTDRQRLNAFHLGDEGLEALRDAVFGGQIHVSVPEEGALPVVAWLLDQGHDEIALDLLTTLQPWMDRLRFYPRTRAEPRPAGSCVRIATVGEVSRSLAEVEPQRQIAAMNETLRVWNPLLDRAVTLWLDTVEGDAPILDTTHKGRVTVEGGWPCKQWPIDWVARRRGLIIDVDGAMAEHRLCRRPWDPKSNLFRLVEALRACPEDSRDLTGRDVGWIRRVLANCVTARGIPTDGRHAALRATQRAATARASNVEFAAALIARLKDYPRGGGLASLEPVSGPLGADEVEDLPEGTALPRALLDKLARAWEAPVADLIDAGLISSAEVLAIVLPQITSAVAAAGIADPVLRDLYGQIYAAFRRRRSLLLVDLAHQVRIEELPWVAALAPFRTEGLDAAIQARATLGQATELTLSAFPHTLTPNPLVRELRTLARVADLKLPLVEEVAADIFMGTFTVKWAEAAAMASTQLEGTLYHRYYDLPDPEVLQVPPARSWFRGANPTPRADAFAKLCGRRSQEAGADGRGVPRNGAILEQSQILTTHNLVALVDGLDLRPAVAAMAPDLARRTLRWVVRRQNTENPTRHAFFKMMRNTGIAWRQAIFFLSLCTDDVQREILADLQGWVDQADPLWAQRFGPAVVGLAWVIDGEGFDPGGRCAHGPGRRFLGRSVGPHWMEPERREWR